MRLSQIWWEKTALYILGIRAGHAVADMGEETGTEESKGDIYQDMEGHKEGE